MLEYEWKKVVILGTFWLYLKLLWPIICKYLAKEMKLKVVVNNFGIVRQSVG